jgi:ABC-type polar amino acid transport system ATPase subunit
MTGRPEDLKDAAYLEDAVTATVREPMAPTLCVRDVTKTFGGSQVLRGVSMTVARGETVCIVGPSGSGKSTLLRCCNLLEKPSSGQVEFMGNLVFGRGDAGDAALSRKETEKFRSKITMVFQQFDLFPHLTALQNITLAPRRVLGVPRADAEARARKLLASVGLEKFADSHPRTLSGGQQQRIAIVRALAVDAEMVLFDEPTSALDPEMVAEVLGLIRKLASDGLTMAIVTHEMKFAREVADRILVLDDGAVIEEGDPASVFDSSQARVRRFFDAVLQG